MSSGPINPMAAAAQATPLVQEQLQSERTRQVRKEQRRLRVSSIAEDTFERQVDNPEEVQPPGDEPDNPHQQRRREEPPEDEAPPHVDVTA